jgi:flagellar hook-basal body complex protein FliE
MMTPIAAAKAYATVQKAMAVDPGEVGAQAVSPGGGFGDILKSAMSDAMKASKNAETQISSAEQSLSTVMAIRDQVISAYQEILRMPI